MVRYWYCHKNPPNIGVNLGQPWKKLNTCAQKINDG